MSDPIVVFKETIVSQKISKEHKKKKQEYEEEESSSSSEEEIKPEEEKTLDDYLKEQSQI